jgi:hypothetical protein
MEQDKLKILELTLKQLREKVLADDDVRNMFLKNYPDLDFEEAVDRTLLDLMEYAVEKDYDVLTLSLQGAKLFFGSVLSDLAEASNEEDIDEEVKGDDKGYGKA